MQTRSSGAAPAHARVHTICAFLLVVAVIGGCAQIAGIEEWRPAKCEGELNVDAETCQPTSGCSECMSSQPQECGPERTDCQNDMEGCAKVYQCSTQCEPDADLLGCAKNCCADSSAGNSLFGTYLMCLCGMCQKECNREPSACEGYCM